MLFNIWACFYFFGDVIRYYLLQVVLSSQVV